MKVRTYVCTVPWPASQPRIPRLLNFFSTDSVIIGLRGIRDCAWLIRAESSSRLRDLQHMRFFARDISLASPVSKGSNVRGQMAALIKNYSNFCGFVIFSSMISLNFLRCHPVPTLCPCRIKSSAEKFVLAGCQNALPADSFEISFLLQSPSLSHNVRLVKHIETYSCCFSTLTLPFHLFSFSFTFVFLEQWNDCLFSLKVYNFNIKQCDMLDFQCLNIIIVELDMGYL